MSNVRRSDPKAVERAVAGARTRLIRDGLRRTQWGGHNALPAPAATDKH